jgi:hypothetical protein
VSRPYEREKLELNTERRPVKPSVHGAQTWPKSATELGTAGP